MIVVGCHDGHAAEPAHGPGERLNAGRTRAVVVGDKNMHSLKAEVGKDFAKALSDHDPTDFS